MLVRITRCATFARLAVELDDVIAFLEARPLACGG